MIVQWKCILFTVAFSLGWTLNQIENQRIKPSSYKQRSFLLQWILPLFLSSFLANIKSCTVIHKWAFVKLQSLLTITTFLAWDQPTFTSFSLTIILICSCHLVEDLDGKVSETGIIFCVLHSFWHNEHPPPLFCWNQHWKRSNTAVFSQFKIAPVIILSVTWDLECAELWKSFKTDLLEAVLGQTV